MHEQGVGHDENDRAEEKHQDQPGPAVIGTKGARNNENGRTRHHFQQFVARRIDRKTWYGDNPLLQGGCRRSVEVRASTRWCEGGTLQKAERHREKKTQAQPQQRPKLSSPYAVAFTDSDAGSDADGEDSDAN